MARPTTKPELIEAANAQFDKLWRMIEAMPEEKQAAFDFGGFEGKEAHWTRDKNLRDVLIHLHEWHKLLLGWAAANQKGEAKPFLPAPYNWKTYGDMNMAFWQSHQATPLDEAKGLFQSSHADVMAMLEALPAEGLFVKGAYAWTGGSTLGSYCVSATAGHYDWAIKKLKKNR